MVDVFPSDIPGLAWSITRAPRFATRTQQSISGRQLRVVDQPYPIWTWTLTYDFLRDGHDIRFGRGLGTNHALELYELLGFYTRQQGAFNMFLYDDPSDNSVTNQGIGAGDGSNTRFQLVRTLSAPSYGGLFTEPLTQINSTSTTIYVNGAPVPFNFQPYGVVNLASPPAPGALVTATFKYYWPVHFVEDTYEFENWNYQLWLLKKISFESILLP